MMNRAKFLIVLFIIFLGVVIYLNLDRLIISYRNPMNTEKMVIKDIHNNYSSYFRNIGEYRKKTVEEFTFPDGIKLRAFPNHYPDYWNAITTLQWEPRTFTIFNRMIKRGDVVVDFGAWVGPTALYAGLLTDTVFALEPDPIAFERLAANVYINPIMHNRIIIENTCISGKNGILTFYLSEGGGNSISSLVKPTTSYKEIDIECITLESWANRRGVYKINFIKIDIEGGEKDVLPSFESYFSTLPKIPDLYISFHPDNIADGTDYDRMASVLHKLYRVCYYEDTQREVPLSSGGVLLQFLKINHNSAVLCTNKLDIDWSYNFNPKN